MSLENQPLKDSGERQEFSTGARRDVTGGKGAFYLLPMYSLFRLSTVFEKGAQKYGPSNWRRGIPLSRYLDSALRHLSEYAAGFRDEDHIGQAMWNVACLIETKWMIDRGELPEELNDLLPELEGAPWGLNSPDDHPTN